ncbi:MAG: NAD(P)-binding domain-containing protein [Bacteroidota bacterium]|nr:NAD(P)-binding domain-containing protein [Bacteroidota bacterium]
MNNIYDLLIIGAGPAGISQAVEARANGVDANKILVLEKGSEHSWVIRTIYPENKLVTVNYKGVEAVCHGRLCLPDASKNEVISYLDRAINNSGVEVKYKTEVQSIEAIGDSEKPLFKIVSGNDTYYAKVTAIAIGVFGKPNKPSYKIPPPIRCNIKYDVNSFKEISGANILVVGGGDTASEYCQFLEEKGNDVTLSYRGNGFNRMNSINENSILAMNKRNKVAIYWNSNIQEVVKSENNKPLAKFVESKYGEKEFDYIVYALGGTTPKNFLKSAKILFKGNNPIVGSDGESNIKGLYLSGDLNTGAGKGSIVQAFNNAKITMNSMCDNYLQCHTGI